MISRSDLLYIVESDSVIKDLSNTSSIVKKLGTYDTKVIRHMREGNIKTRVRNYPHVSKCDIIELGRHTVYTPDNIRDVVDVENGHYGDICSSEKNIKEIIDTLSRMHPYSVVKVHISLPPITTLLTSLCDNVIVTDLFHNRLEDGSVIMEATSKTISKDIYSNYGIRFTSSERHTYSYTNMKRVSIPYIFCSLESALEDTKSIYKLHKHIKLYSNGSVSVIMIHITSDEYRKNYYNMGLYHNIFILDEKLSELKSN